MTQSWPLTRLAEVLVPIARSEAVEPMKEYRLLGIRLNGAGAFLRETKTGAQSAASSLNQVKAGDFIYSRLYAWSGAFGVIGSELNDCYVSSEFPTFLPKHDELDVEFLRLWFRLRNTLVQVEADSSGSTPLTRNRFKENFFLDLQIPLPLLAEQRRIVARFQELATKLEEARGLRASIDTDIYNTLLGAYWEIVQGVPRHRMDEVAPLHRRPVDVLLDKEYHELGVRSFGKGTFHKPTVTGADLGTKKVFWLKPGDLVFNIVFAWEGAVAVVKPENDGRIGSHRFLACVPKEGLATAHFLWFHFMTDEGLQQLGDASPGGAGRNRTLGLEALARIKVPLPIYEKQLWFERIFTKFEALKALQAETQAELDAMLPAVLDKAFKGEL